MPEGPCAHVVVVPIWLYGTSEPKYLLYGYMDPKGSMRMQCISVYEDIVSYYISID